MTDLISTPIKLLPHGLVETGDSGEMRGDIQERKIEIECPGSPIDALSPIKFDTVRYGSLLMVL